MPTPSSYVSPSDLKAAVGPQVYVQIFDDDGDGNVSDNDAGVQLVLERAHAEVLSYLPRLYGIAVVDDPTRLPQGIPTLLKSAELDFAVALSFERHPEYVRSYGEEGRSLRWKRAEAKMQRIGDAKQIPTDNVPPPQPVTGGGVITDPNPRRTIVTSADGTDNAGDF